MSARRLLGLLLSTLILVSASFAQAPKKSASRPPELVTVYKILVNERVEFVRRAYQLSEEQAKKLQTELESLIPEHMDYMDNNGKRLRLRSAALAKVLPREDTMAPSTREKLTAKYQNEIYEIHTKAPLSLTNSVKRAEALLSKTQIEQGRAALSKRFKKELKGAPLDIEKIDRLVLQPVRPAPQKKPKPPPNLASTKKPARPNLIPKPRQETKPPPPLPRGSESQTKPPKQLEPAPPVDIWQETLNKAISKYSFSEAQQKIANRVLESCRKRAQSHLQNNKAAYDEANQATDPQEKTKKLKELNQSLDKLYGELNNRIESIATVEQKHASAARKERTAEKDEK